MAARGHRLGNVELERAAALGRDLGDAPGDGLQVHADGRAAGGVAPSRSCSISWRIFSSELSTVSSMSCWNSGLLCSRLAFFIISDSW
jgi:hypothetical protein